MGERGVGVCSLLKSWVCRGFFPSSFSIDFTLLPMSTLIKFNKYNKCLFVCTVSIYQTETVLSFIKLCSMSHNSRKGSIFSIPL